MRFLFKLFSRKKENTPAPIVIKLPDWTYAEYRLANQKMDDDGGFISHSQRLAAAERKLAKEYDKYWLANFRFLQAKARVRELSQ